MLRRAMLAGSFYPAEAQTLAQSVDEFLLQGEEALHRSGKERGPFSTIMLPHAGHVYCGRVIGETLARAAVPERLIILCPNHTGAAGPLAVWPSGAWQTPLGNVMVDTQLAAELIASGGGYAANTGAHLHEHAIEVLLPFFQRSLKTLSIVPVVVSAAPRAIPAAARSLAEVVARARARGVEVGVVISSDLHHFGTDASTRELDMLALRCLIEAQPGPLLESVIRNNISMCGVLPAMLALLAGRDNGLYRGELVAHTTSAEASGDVSRVVGYAGLVFHSSGHTPSFP